MLQNEIPLLVEALKTGVQRLAPTILYTWSCWNSGNDWFQVIFMIRKKMCKVNWEWGLLLAISCWLALLHENGLRNCHHLHPLDKRPERKNYILLPFVSACHKTAFLLGKYSIFGLLFHPTHWLIEEFLSNVSTLSV